MPFGKDKSMEQYTKGEWKVDKISNRWNLMDVVCGGRVIIASVHAQNQEANARLIAQAPRMLEAIKSALVEIEDGSANHAHLILTEVKNKVEGE